MKTILATICYCCMLTSLFGQDPPIKWGKVPAKDLAMKVYPLDTLAEAVVLVEYAHLSVYWTDSGAQSRLFNQKRIKILKESGLRYGDVVLYFRKDDNNDGIRDVNAQVIDPSGKTTAIKKNAIFYNEVEENIYSVSFSFPDLKVGSVIEYAYQLFDDDVYTPPAYYFQKEIPVRWSELRFESENSFSYVMLFEGNKKLPPTKLPNGATVYQDGPAKIFLGERRFYMENAPAIPASTDFITNMDDYRTRIKFQLNKVRSPSSAVVSQVLYSWEKVRKDFWNDDFFGLNFTKKSRYKKAFNDLAPLIDENASDRDKLETIYNFVLNRVAWDGDFWYLSDRTPDEVYEAGKGDSGEMNMLLLALMKANGIDCHPVLISTRTHGKTTQIYPIVTQFNHFIVFALLDGKIKLLDALDPDLPVGYIHLNSLNFMGWEMQEEVDRWISIEASICKDAFSTALKFKEDGTLVGVLKTKNGAYSGYLERKVFKDIDPQKKWKERLEGLYNSIAVDSVFTNHLNDASRPLAHRVYFTVEDFAINNEDFIYLPPVFYSGFSQNPFKLQERHYPIDFPFPFENRAIFSLRVPNGYSVESLPEPGTITLQDGSGIFDYKVKQLGDVIQVIQLITFKKQRYLPETYQEVKAIFENIAARMEGQIVFKKNT